MKILLIGGARSGKSSLATRWARERSYDVGVIVTATASDPEMSARILAHRMQRPPTWRVREEPVRLGRALRASDETGRMLIVDCLTLWTANCLWPPELPHATSVATEYAPDLDGWRREREDFLSALRGYTGDIIVVSNEVGTGIVPTHAAARLFADEHGWMNQAVAAECDEVYQVIAAIPVRIK